MTKKQMEDGRWYCKRCEAWKLPEEFYANKWRANGLSNWCAACMKAIQKQYRKEGKVRTSPLGVMKQQVLDQQNGRCGCCGRLILQVKQLPYDIRTKKLICHRCAIGLSYVRDKEFVQAARVYLAGRP